jgi:hypothetical protein
MLKKEFQFNAAAARFNDLLYLSLQDRGLVAKEKAHSTFSAYDRGVACSCGGKVMSWDTQAMCVVKKPVEKLVAVSGKGNVFTFVGGKETQETITPEPYDIAGLATIGGYAFACGSDRQVFKRVDEGQWISMHAPDSSKLDGTYGFESIAGFDEEDIYAVGWKGEIWHFNGEKWRQIDSPTIQILTSVVCAEDGVVYIGGRNGTLIKGRGDIWEIVNRTGYNGDIWSMQFFDKKLFIATLDRICTLKEQDLEPVKMGNDYPGTCYHLTTSDGVMWSIGTDDIFSFDGKTWTRIE